MRAFIKDGAIVEFPTRKWKDDGTIFDVEETPNYYRLRAYGYGEIPGTDGYGSGCLYLPKSCEEELIYIKEEDMNYKFYMVLVDGTNSTSHKHDTIGKAREEAARLVNKCSTNHGATILQAIEYVAPAEAPVDIHAITASGSLGKKI